VFYRETIEMRHIRVFQGGAMALYRRCFAVRSGRAAAGRAACRRSRSLLDIDANGIVNVHAKDKAPARSSRSASSIGGLGADIQKMVKDAEAREEDKRRRRSRPRTTPRLVHSTEKCSLSILSRDRAARDRERWPI
jgi:molecular chaperone DnaK (HSP70)